MNTRSIFDEPVFTTTWEDLATVRRALNATPGDRIASVAGAGDNVIGLLLDDPVELLAFDTSRAQLSLLELRLAALQQLDHGAFLELLGNRSSERRLELFGRCAQRLSGEALAFWTPRSKLIERGVFGCGRYERVIGLFRRLLFQPLIGKQKLAAICRQESLDGLDTFFDQAFANPLVRLGLKGLLNKPVLSHLLDSAWYDYVDVGPMDRFFLDKLRRMFTWFPPRHNHFMAFVFLGRYLDEVHVPAYLKAEHFELLKSRAGRVKLFQLDALGFVRSQEAHSLDRVNFSNIFEWMPQSEMEAIFSALLPKLADGASVHYRSVLARRELPDGALPGISQDEQLNAELLRQDRSFKYNQLNALRFAFSEGGRPGQLVQIS